MSHPNMSIVSREDPCAGVRSGSAQSPQSYRMLSGREAGVECWRIERVAIFLDVTKKRVYQLIQERRLQAIRLGPRQMRVLRQSIDDYIKTLLASEQTDELEGDLSS